MCIDLEDLEECLKVGIEDVGSCYLGADYSVILKDYEDFFTMCAAKTERLNPQALAKCAKSQFALNAVEAKILGQHMAGASALVKKSGAKMTTGEKLDPAVIRLSNQMCNEPEETSSASTKKEETGPPPLKQEATEPPRKKVKAEPTDGPLLSPSSALSMYGAVVNKEVGLPSSGKVRYEKRFQMQNVLNPRICIRESTGSRPHVLSFGGAKCRHNTKEMMCEIGDQVLDKLRNKGCSVEDAKKFGQRKSESKAKMI